MKPIETIIVGKNKVNGIFYMVNNKTTTYDNLRYSGGKERDIRKKINPKIYPSKLRAEGIVKRLRKEDNFWSYEWWTEPLYE